MGKIFSNACLQQAGLLGSKLTQLNYKSKLRGRKKKISNT
jgi:hypothetical protein